MSEQCIYEVDYSQYKRMDYAGCCYRQSELKRTFHNCPKIMEKKKILEKKVRFYKDSIELKNHFKIKFRERKENFYSTIIHDILKESNEREIEICNIVKDILFMYSKKKEELEYVDDLSNYLECEISRREEERESMIEYFRGCD